tara:strand:- start:911 stop:1084 length:174 start_codon:yes stop_codon:yes gene_type:complete
MIQTVKKLNNLINNQLGGYEMTLTDGTISSVPLDEANTDYKNILQWVADGNTIQETD